MMRQADAKWFESTREDLAVAHPGKWLVVFKGELDKIFEGEEQAVQYAVNTHGIDAASVFHAVPQDPFTYVGA